jgi:hypothetical protein
VHKIKQPKKGNTIPDRDYTTEAITNSALKKGDTLEITPLRGGKFPIPAEIPTDATNTLFFKTIKSNWLSYPVKKITAKPDIVLP